MRGWLSPAPGQLCLTLLDGPHVERDGQTQPSAAATHRLLAYLALHGAVTRSSAAGALWPDSSEQRALSSLRQAVWRSRSLGEDLVTARGDTLRLGPEVWVDVLALEALAALVQADGAVTARHVAAARAARGDLLADWDDDWVLFQRERLRQLRLHLLEALSGRLLAAHDYAGALDAALEAVRVEPLRESGHAAVIAVHLAENNYVEALRQYERFHRLAVEELGLEPSPELRRLLQRPRVPRQTTSGGEAGLLGRTGWRPSTSGHDASDGRRGTGSRPR